MRLNQKTQYALLMTIYLHRSGMARIQDMAATMGLSENFLSQVAGSLKAAGIISVKRGPGGGYEIAAGRNPSVLDVLRAMETPALLTNQEALEHEMRGVEGRTLNHILGLTQGVMRTVLDQSVATLSADLVNQEVQQLNTLNEDSVMS